MGAHIVSTHTGWHTYFISSFVFSITILSVSNHRCCHPLCLTYNLNILLFFLLQLNSSFWSSRAMKHTIRFESKKIIYLILWWRRQNSISYRLNLFFFFFQPLFLLFARFIHSFFSNKTRKKARRSQKFAFAVAVFCLLFYRIIIVSTHIQKNADIIERIHVAANKYYDNWSKEDTINVYDVFSLVHLISTENKFHANTRHWFWALNDFTTMNSVSGYCHMWCIYLEKRNRIVDSFAPFRGCNTITDLCGPRSKRKWWPKNCITLIE